MPRPKSQEQERPKTCTYDSALICSWAKQSTSTVPKTRSKNTSTMDVVSMMWQHVPMSSIRDEDRCCYIIGIFTLLSCLSHCYHRLVLVLCACSHCAVRFAHSVASPSPLCSRWVCVPYASECVHYSVNGCTS